MSTIVASLTISTHKYAYVIDYLASNSDGVLRKYKKNENFVLKTAIYSYLYNYY